MRSELLKEVERQGIRVCYEKKFVRLEEVKERVKVYFEDGECVEVGRVVGADGIRSRVRDFVDADCKPCFSGTMVLYGMLPKSALEKKLGQGIEKLPVPSMLFGKEGSFTIWSRDYNGEEVGYFANIEVTDRDKEGWKELGDNKEGLRDLLEERFCGSGWPEQVEIMVQEAAAGDFNIWP